MSKARKGSIMPMFKFMFDFEYYNKAIEAPISLNCWNKMLIKDVWLIGGCLQDCTLHSSVIFSQVSIMSKIKAPALPLDEWVRQRNEQLSRIDQRIDQNIHKYRKRKSNRSDQSQRKSEEDEESRESMDRRASAERDYDEIQDDWRKLQDTIQREIPEYMGKHTKPKTMNKISTISKEADRIKKKIEARLQEDDLAEYRYKQSAKKWENKTAISALRQPRKEQRREDYEEVGDEGDAGELKRSLILEDINKIGRQTLSQLQRQLPLNEKLVDDYEVEKREDRIFTIILLALVLLLVVLDALGLRINTRLHRFFFDFLQA